MDGRRGGGEGNFLIALIRGSIILNALDRFTAWVYEQLKNGFFGWLFTGYNPSPASRIGPRIAGSRTALHLRELRFGICRRIESSVIVNGTRALVRYLLGCRLKVYGVFLLTISVFSAGQFFISAAVKGRLASVLEDSVVTLFYAAAMAAIPLILSKRNLAEGITDSAVGRLFLKITAYRPENLQPEGSGGHLNLAFLSGAVLGVLTHFISFPLMLAGLLGLAAAYLILVRPELGVLALFFVNPWLPPLIQAAVVILTALCLLIKLLRRKRILRLEPLDLLAGVFAAFLFFGGIISLSPLSLEWGLLRTCLAMGYFLTVVLMRSREWVTRCAAAAVLSGALQALLGIFYCLTGRGYTSQAWLDSEMFGSIGRRAVGTLENPNMLGEYLILLIPVAAAMILGNGEGLGRVPAFLCAGALSACLILTWSRGAWLGLIFGLLVFLMIWNRRSLWLLVVGFVSLPILPAVLPASIIQRVTSIGNMADSSTSYRVSIWRASASMIRDNFLTGIGMGEGPWKIVYPRYAYMGVEAAPHSHNLFMQIWLDLGLGGIVIFLIFLFVLFQAAFTMFRQISGDCPLINPDISPAPLKTGYGAGTAGGDGFSLEERMRRGKNQLRISAAGPLCGIAAVLVQGLTDYSWYNNRLFLMFWLMAGLTACYIRSGREQLDDAPFQNRPDESESVLPRTEKKKRRAERKGRQPAAEPAKN